MDQPVTSNRLVFLFRSTKGLVLVGIALVAIVAAIWGTLSGPLAELGVSGVTIRVLGMKLAPLQREGRIVILYHSIAMAAVAILVYFITSFVEMKKQERATINTVATVGYLCSLIFGLAFAYFGFNFVFHGLFLFGMSLMYFTGLMLAAAVCPWRKDYRDSAGHLDIERTALFVVVVTTLISALFGAVTGSLSGNGFQTFLAENVIRVNGKPWLQLAIIGHLHIMLALFGAGVLLVVSRWLKFKGSAWHKWAMPMVIIGATILSIGVWMVVPFEEIAHWIIYVGSAILLLGGLFLLIFTWRKLIRERVAELGIKKAGFWRSLGALLHDPLKFGATWQMLFMNFVTTFIGLFMAVELTKVIRMYPADLERIELVGHWHTLAVLMATIILFIYVDAIGIKGRIRQWFGWLVIVGSDMAFGAIAIYELEHLWVAESAQQPLVNVLMLLADVGLGLVLACLGALLVWRLVDLFKRKGRWTKELAEAASAGEVSR
ncbi:MAG: hypothetical protein NTX46_00575 [Chloroflexi bacterium]|nr:hypothetical protein [Chloroflexota bacterium]